MTITSHDPNRRAHSNTGDDAAIANPVGQATAFIRDFVGPVLKAAAEDLKARGIAAVTTEQYDEHTAQCLLTVGGDEDIAASVLVFEVYQDLPVPQIQWSPGGAPTPLSHLDLAAVSRIVTGFLNSSSRAGQA